MVAETTFHGCTAANLRMFSMLSLSEVIRVWNKLHASLVNQLPPGELWGNAGTVSCFSFKMSKNRLS